MQEQNCSPVKLDGVQRAMARAIASSGNPYVTIWDDAHVSWGCGMRPTLRLIRALARACQAYPQFNAHYNHNEETLEMFSYIDMGIAMHVVRESGNHHLYVPVVRSAETAAEEPSRLSNTLIELRKRAISRRLVPLDYENPTITLSNFGALSAGTAERRVAGKYATPTVIPPRVAILAVGRIIEIDRTKRAFGKYVPKKTIPLSLTFDHRPLTGGEAGLFLRAIIDDLELEC